jgi:hypothetical protein
MASGTTVVRRTAPDAYFACAFLAPRRAIRRLGAQGVVRLNIQTERRQRSGS